jgi:DNA-binding NtrC family response regulator
MSSGDDPSLLSVRTLVLEHSGFAVVPCLPEKVLTTLSERDDIQAVVLCHSIDLDERIELAEQMREASPNLAIVVMHRTNEAFDAANCDSVVESLAGPDALVRAVRRALKKRQG